MKIYQQFSSEVLNQDITWFQISVNDSFQVKNSHTISYTINSQVKLPFIGGQKHQTLHAALL